MKKIFIWWIVCSSSVYFVYSIAFGWQPWWYPEVIKWLFLYTELMFTAIALLLILAVDGQFKKKLR
jgi:hypothetical protein